MTSKNIVLIAVIAVVAVAVIAAVTIWSVNNAANRSSQAPVPTTVNNAANTAGNTATQVSSSTTKAVQKATQSSGGGSQTQTNTQTQTGGGSSLNNLIQQYQQYTQSQSQSSGAATINYTDSGFSPATLTVVKGTRVTFFDDSSALLWPVSTDYPVSGGCVVNTVLDSCGALGAGQSWSITINSVGTWHYYNHSDSRYSGTIVVTSQ